MPADAADLELAAQNYETEIVRVLGGTARFDVVLLGVGPDGHVCSLFPGHPALRTSRRGESCAVMDSPKPPPARLTLTLAALEGAESVRRRLRCRQGAGRQRSVRESRFAASGRTGGAQFQARGLFSSISMSAGISAGIA